MDSSFYTDLVGTKFPFPESWPTSGLGALRRIFKRNFTETTGRKLSASLNVSSGILDQKLINESSLLSSSSGNIENGATNNLPNVSKEEIANLSPLDQEVLAILSWMEILEDGSSMFNLPLLASVDTSLPIAKRVETQNTAWPRSMLRKPAASPTPSFSGLETTNATMEDQSWRWNSFLGKDYLCEEVKQQLRTDGPVRDVFVFPPRQLSPEPPFLNIFCHRSYNLMNDFVHFTIQLQNLSRKASVDAMMDPSGLMTRATIELRSVGHPMKIWSVVKNVEQCGGILEGSLDIPVSRSYADDCRKECLRIHCEYKKEVDPAPRQLVDIRSARTRNCSNYRKVCKLWGLTADLQTNMLYYTDRASHEVVCVHPAGYTLFKFGRSGRASTSLYRPTGIAYCKEYRRLVIADKDNHRICLFTMDGQFISSFGSKGHENGKLSYPWDVAVSPDGQHIAVTDSRNKRIQLFDRFGNFLRKYSVFESNPYEYKTELDYPRGICFDDTGKNIYVSDFNLHNVLCIPLDFSHHRKMIPEGQLLRPQGVAVDWLGNLLIVDSRKHCIRHVSPRSDLISDIKRVLDKPLDFPMNVCTLAGGFVAVLDGTGKIHIF
ncbi:E3 ubiquitin-protein ligase TRIM71 [Orchesella cincta]|uniref:E3 ubiquitin-protein ligase TRIM71 n=1 Tax=Orchesella cincta TaxID=48709 RepID=A0A1D2N4X5_ORCCI|nr:E3 ubiquitin-protein ligase TRIM71 [Orchesella cincta]